MKRTVTYAVPIIISVLGIAAAVLIVLAIRRAAPDPNDGMWKPGTDQHITVHVDTINGVPMTPPPCAGAPDYCGPLRRAQAFGMLDVDLPAGVRANIERLLCETKSRNASVHSTDLDYVMFIDPNTEDTYIVTPPAGALLVSYAVPDACPA